MSIKECTRIHYSIDLEAFSFFVIFLETKKQAIKEDISKIQNAKTDYSRLIKYYKRRLVDYGVMKEIRDFKTKDGKFKKEKISSRMEEIVSA